MSKKIIVAILIFIVDAVSSGQVSGVGGQRAQALRDGFVLRSVDGRLIVPDQNDVWVFELESEVSDDRATLKTGTSLALLPSATLEKITEDVKIRSEASYRLWGRVTKYKGRNFLFPIYFLPLSKIKEQPAETPQATEKSVQQDIKPIVSPFAEEPNRETTVNEPNDILAMPPEIVEKLKGKRIVPMPSPEAEIQQEAEPIIQPPRLRTVSYSIPQDSILADRTAILVGQGGWLVFILDAFGRNVPGVSLRLLPCEALELTEQRQSAELEPLRFKIAGIVTEYKGDKYLLLQKATQVYSHGNFAR